MHVVRRWTVCSHNGQVRRLPTVRCGHVFGKWRHSMLCMSGGQNLRRDWQYLVHSLLCWDIRLWFLHFVYELRCWNLLGRFGCNGGRILRELCCWKLQRCWSGVLLALCNQHVQCRRQINLHSLCGWKVERRHGIDCLLGVAFANFTADCPANFATVS